MKKSRPCPGGITDKKRKKIEKNGGTGGKTHSTSDATNPKRQNKEPLRRKGKNPQHSCPKGSAGKDCTSPMGLRRRTWEGQLASEKKNQMQPVGGNRASSRKKKRNQEKDTEKTKRWRQKESGRPQNLLNLGWGHTRP